MAWDGRGWEPACQMDTEFRLNTATDGSTCQKAGTALVRYAH